MSVIKKKKSQDIDIGSLFTQAVEELKIESFQSEKKADIISFAKSFLGINLYPSQEIILKFFYANSRFNEDIFITDVDIEKIKSWSIPQPWLYDGENCKYNLIKNKDHIFMELILVCGRRSSKSFLSSLMSSYEAYKLLCIPNPQEFYRIDSDIHILNVAKTGEQASDVIFKQVSKFVKTCPFFANIISKDIINSIKLYTENDKKRNQIIEKSGGNPLEGSVVLKSGHSNSNALRGLTVITLILDEMAHYIDNQGNSSAAEVYNALSRGCLTFRKFKDGRIIAISSPAYKSGGFWDLYQKAQKVDSMLLFQVETKDMNPEITEEELKHEMEKDPITYLSEFGARFRGFSTNSYFPISKIEAAFNARSGWVKQEKRVPGYSYYSHIDTAFNSHNWAFIICHPEFRHDSNTGQSSIFIVEDYYDLFAPPKDGYIDPDMIMDTFVLPILKKFKVCSVTYDQMFSLEQRKKLVENGINHKMMSGTGHKHNQIYETLRDYLITERVILCQDDANLHGEMQFLTIDYNKTPPKIEFDENSEFPHDDLVDCLAGAVYNISLREEGTWGLPMSTTVATSIR